MVDVRAIAAEAARAGGNVLRATLGQRREIAWKRDDAGELSVVTDADHRADAAIQAVIDAATGGHAILSEEGASPPAGAEHLWVIDPLDGTDEFSRGSPSCCVAVAYLRDRTPEVGAVYDPFRDELFLGQRGHGAWLNDVPIAVSSIGRVEDAVVAFSSPDRRRSTASFVQTTAVFDALIATTRQVRVYGSTALEICWVANGRLDAKVSLRGRAWDFMAAAVVLAAAGGQCQDLHGHPLSLATVGAVASNGHIQEELLGLVHAAWTSQRS